MSLAEIHFFSPSVGLSTAMNVILPDAAHGPGPFPVFYLLHGLSDDHTIWCRRTNIERYVAPLPLIVVMPEVGRGWYTNSAAPPGRPYEDLIIKDVLPFIDRTFKTIPDRAGRVIGGLSMGGYGAVKLALKFPHLFSSATSHSGALMGPLYKKDNRTPEARAALDPEFLAIFGPNFSGGPDDPVALAAACPPHLRPALRIDCGTADFLLNPNRDFHAALTAQNFPHQYEEFPGEHTWDYWDTHIQKALTFHAATLFPKPAALSP